MTQRDECAAIVRQLWPFLDGALPDQWQARVTEHLLHCVNCRSHFDFERAFLVAVRGAGAGRGAVDDEALRQRIVGALAADGFAPA